LSSTVVAILGMHRSGTSWLAGSLQAFGLELGKVDTVARHNEKGNRERKAVRRIHNRVLADNGGSWRQPTWPSTWSPKRQSALHAHITAMNERYQVWGFKDPRSLLVMDEWRRQVPNLVRIGIYRHPNAVWRSLEAKYGTFGQDEALALWRLYNLRLVDELHAEPFPLLRFDTDPETLGASLVSAAGTLGLGSARPLAFFDRSLVHHDGTSSQPIPADVADVWSDLEAFSLAQRQLVLEA
jgi:hypothetical protein